MHKEASVVYLKGSVSSDVLNKFLKCRTVFDNSSTSARQYFTSSCLKFQSVRFFYLSYHGLNSDSYSSGLIFLTPNMLSSGILPT